MNFDMTELLSAADRISISDNVSFRKFLVRANGPGRLFRCASKVFRGRNYRRNSLQPENPYLFRTGVSLQSYSTLLGRYGFSLYNSGFFVKYNFKIIVSIDGPKYIHDKLRRGCPYDIVINHIHNIKNSHLNSKLELNCTYTRYHKAHITDKCLNDFFEDIGNKYHISNVITNVDWLKLPDSSDSEKALLI
jgi:hypothetical protein